MQEYLPTLSMVVMLTTTDDVPQQQPSVANPVVITNINNRNGNDTGNRHDVLTRHRCTRQQNSEHDIQWTRTANEFRCKQLSDRIILPQLGRPATGVCVPVVQDQGKLLRRWLDDVLMLAASVVEQSQRIIVALCTRTHNLPNGSDVDILNLQQLKYDLKGSTYTTEKFPLMKH